MHESIIINYTQRSRQSAIHQDVHTSQRSRQSAIHQDVHTSQRSRQSAIHQDVHTLPQSQSSGQSAIHQDVHTSQSSGQSAIHQDVHTSQSYQPTHIYGGRHRWVVDLCTSEVVGKGNEAWYARSSGGVDARGGLKPFQPLVQRPHWPFPFRSYPDPISSQSQQRRRPRCPPTRNG